MKLIYLNAELNANQEYELIHITPNGFSVLIKYTEDSWMYKAGYTEQTFENCTEVHNIHDSSADVKEIAFESDIRGEGFTRRISDIKEVIISL